MRNLVVAAVLTVGVVACAAPEPPPAPPPSSAITDSIRTPYEIGKGYLTAAAEQVSEDLYAFQATPEVRSLGGILAHLADANFMICGASSGEAPPSAESVEQTATSKADIQQALADSFALCDRAFEALDDQAGAEGVALMLAEGMDPMQTTRLGALSFATAHQFEHYGNVVTYMRLNDMVPPSSQPPPEGGM